MQNKQRHPDLQTHTLTKINKKYFPQDSMLINEVPSYFLFLYFEMKKQSLFSLLLPLLLLFYDFFYC